MANLKRILSDDKPFPELRKPLDFGDFHEDLAGNYVDVWLNLSAEMEERIRAHKETYRAYEERRDEILDALESAELDQNEAEALRQELQDRNEAMQDATAEIYARLWGCTPEEYKQLVVLDDVLTDWLINETWRLIGEYRAGRLKARSG
jgi:hypothetical protein